MIPPITVPDGATCQEVSILSGQFYIACGQPAVAIVYHEKDRRGYYMCEMCACHNVRNRGGKLVTAVGEDRIAAKFQSMGPR